MKNEDPRRDPNSKRILEDSQLTAPILKAVLFEYNDVSVDEIANIYLRNSKHPGSGRIELLSQETNEFKEIVTRYDIRFRAYTPPKYDYDMMIIMEVLTSKNNLSISIRKIVYVAKALTRQEEDLEKVVQDTLDEDFKDEKESKKDRYRELDHPVLISLEFDPPKGFANKIVQTVLNPENIELSDGLLGDVKPVGKLNLLKTQKEAFEIGRFIGIYVDINQRENLTGIFRYLALGLFNPYGSKEERLAVIEEFAGPLRKETKMSLEHVWGSEDFYRKIYMKQGREEGRKEGRKEGVEIGREEGARINLINNIKALRKNGISSKVIAQSFNMPIEEIDRLASS